jgi:hemerythrin-like metal-binding protein
MSLQEKQWNIWVMQTARHYGDIASIIHCTGIEDIDNEHRTMVGQVLEINRFIDSLDHSHFSLALVYQVGELCTRLRETTISHFEKEENIFQKYQILGMSDHAHKHRLIIEQLDEMIEDLSGGRLNVTLKLKEAILEWVVVHINEEDAHIFGPHNIANTIAKHPDAKELYNIFSNTNIPSLDQIHAQLHHAAAQMNPAQDHLNRIAQLLNLSFQIENNLSDRYHISANESYKKDHSQLSESLTQISKLPEKEKLQALQIWFSKWWKHHRSHHLQQFEVSQWMFKAIEKASDPKELVKLFPPLNQEELDQGRLYTYRIIINIVKCFCRLEAYENHEASIKEMQSNLKKLRGHLRFQHEQEEDLLKGLPSHIQQLHIEEHRAWLKSLDYFSVLMDSTKMALGRATLSKIISHWAAHLLFFDSPDHGMKS